MPWIQRRSGDLSAVPRTQERKRKEESKLWEEGETTHMNILTSQEITASILGRILQLSSQILHRKLMMSASLRAAVRSLASVGAAGAGRLVVPRAKVCTAFGLLSTAAWVAHSTVGATAPAAETTPCGCAAAKAAPATTPAAAPAAPALSVPILVALLDFTLLDPKATPAELEAFFQRAVEARVGAVCVMPEHVAAARAALPPSIVVACTPGVCVASDVVVAVW